MDISDEPGTGPTPSSQPAGATPPPLHGQTPPPATTPSPPAEAAPPPSGTTPGFRTRARRMMFLLGPGVGLGFFSPGDVNEYMEDWLHSQGTVVGQTGTASMVINLVPRISFVFAPIEYVQIEALGELGWGPKSIQIANGESKLFSFIRGSAGGVVSGHLPLSRYRFSLSAGFGLLYHYMEFEEYSAETLGYRAQVGFRIYRRIFTPEVFIMFDYAMAETDRLPGVMTYSSPEPFELNFTSVVMGANLYFNLTPNH